MLSASYLSPLCQVCAMTIPQGERIIKGKMALIYQKYNERSIPNDTELITWMATDCHIQPSGKVIQSLS